MKEKFEHRLEQAVGAERIFREEPMKLHTTFRIGGPAQYLVAPRTKEEVQEVVRLCREEGMPWYIIGNGSNLLVSDKGYRGVVIQLFKDFADIRTEGTRIFARAGASLAKIAAEALRNSLTGSCIMNAGAYGGEMKDVLESVTVLDGQGDIRVLPREELDMGYRTSRAAREGYIVLEAVIALEPGDESKIREKLEDLKERRTSKQPLEYPSAGSTFKRPEGYFAGKLIQDAGLRGLRVGDAMVSEKHCGFVINCGSATAADVDRLIRQVQERVRENSGVTLEPEVKRLGEF